MIRIQISQVANGFMVDPASDERHTMRDFNQTHVFETQENLFKFLEEAFNPLIEAEK